MKHAARITPLLCLLATPLLASAELDTHWAQWRGPRMDGVAPAGDPPTRWSEQENVRLKIAVPGRGMGSPVVWGDAIFVLTTTPVDPATAAEPRTKGHFVKIEPVRQRFEVLAYSRTDGRLLWREVAAEAMPAEETHGDGSWASASAITDGKRLIAHFGSTGTFAYDLAGKKLWSIDLGDMKTRNGFGEGASPALAGDTVVVNWDHEESSFIVALDATTGKERWRMARPGEATSWSTPLVVEVGGKRQVVVAATGKSRGYDLETGAELWSLPGMTMNAIPTPIHADGLVALMSGFRGTMLQAIDLRRAKGEIAGTDAVRYVYERDTPYVPSPLLYQGQLYFIKHNGNVLTALEFATGKPVFTEQRLSGLQGVYASPVAAAGRIYVVGRDGATVVLAAGATPTVLATNKLDDHFDASPAIVGRDLILRGHRHLYVLTAP